MHIIYLVTFNSTVNTKRSIWHEGCIKADKSIVIHKTKQCQLDMTVKNLIYI